MRFLTRCADTVKVMLSGQASLSDAATPLTHVATRQVQAALDPAGDVDSSARVAIAFARADALCDPRVPSNRTVLFAVGAGLSELIGYAVLRLASRQTARERMSTRAFRLVARLVLQTRSHVRMVSGSTTADAVHEKTESASWPVVARMR